MVIGLHEIRDCDIICFIFSRQGVIVDNLHGRFARSKVLNIFCSSTFATLFSLCTRKLNAVESGNRDLNIVSPLIYV